MSYFVNIQLSLKRSSLALNENYRCDNHMRFISFHFFCRHQVVPIKNDSDSSGSKQKTSTMNNHSK